MRSAIKSDGAEVYEYVLLYTDDALSIGVEMKDESILKKEIGKYFELMAVQNVPGLYCQGRNQEMEASE
jgi:hypothetical protein